jgi:hypothetical protein
MSWLYVTEQGTYGPIEAPDQETAERIARARCESTGLDFIRVEEAGRV